MKASETPLHTCLSRPIQYTIPIFQRTYSWTIEQTSQLYNDILRLVNNPSIPMHFLGSIVYVQGGLYNTATVTELVIIDGQQRLTTITLLLAALAKYFADKGEDQIVREIRGHYLINHDTSEAQKYKLVLTQNDKDTLTQVIEGKQLLDPVSQRIEENYEYFHSKITSGSVDPQAIYEAFKKLIVVEVSLDRTIDNPQLIFESLNSTGLDLSQADLIRNYVLMGLPKEQQDELYRDFWRPMEEEFGQESYVEYFDAFMRDYLTVKTGKIPKENDVYHTFKRFAPFNEYDKIKLTLQDVQTFSRYFAAIVFEKEPDPDLLRAFIDLVALKVDVVYPFLLEVYDDYSKNKLITKESFLEIVKLIESYVLRRMICGTPTNSLNKTFATLSKEIDKTKYLESFKAIMVLKTSYRAFPNNDFFKEQFATCDIYNKLRCEYILDKLENYGRQEKVIVSEYTIEHIMPQNENLNDDWIRDLGQNWKEIQKIYLHTIGNLTLTAYNPNYSDKSFLVKRDMKDHDTGRLIGFAGSPIHLNQDVGILSQWNEVEIKKRADKLSRLALTIWPYPELSQEILQHYQESLKSEIDHENEETNQDVDTNRLNPSSPDDLLTKIESKTAKDRAVQVMNFCTSLIGVKIDMTRDHITFKTKEIFAKIYPQRVQFWVDVRWVQNDPKHLLQHAHPVYGHIRVRDDVLLDDVFGLIKQSYEKVTK